MRNKDLIVLFGVGVIGYLIYDLYKKGKLPFLNKIVLGKPAQPKKKVNPDKIVLL